MSGPIPPRSALGRSWTARRYHGALSPPGRLEPIGPRGRPFRAFSGHRRGDAGIFRAQLEPCEPLQVDRGAEHREVMRDSFAPAHASSSSAVPATHQMRELALHLGTRGLVVAAPFGGLLACASFVQRGLMGVNLDVPARLGLGTRKPLRARRAARTEACLPRPILGAPNLDKTTRRTG